MDERSGTSADVPGRRSWGGVAHVEKKDEKKISQYVKNMRRENKIGDKKAMKDKLLPEISAFLLQHFLTQCLRMNHEMLYRIY